MNPLIQLKKAVTLSLIVLLFACFALPENLRAVRPAPDGGYPGGNTAEGQAALFSLTTGGFNTAVGYLSLRSNTTNSFNTAVGAGTLLANNAVGADENTAIGAGVLLSNTTGFFNTATGAFALFHNTTGGDNTAAGTNALFFNTGGGGNTAIGDGALLNTSGSDNVGVGVEAGSGVFTASGVTCIGGNVFGEDVDNSTWIGNVYGVATQSGTTAPVVVSDGGQLGTVASSQRFKKDIADMDKASEIILSFRPVTFHYKTDAKKTPQFGLIAEEVAKVNPALVLPDKNGKPYTVRYDQVNAMLLNEFLKEHRTVQEQGATIARLEKQIASLTAGLQRVSAKLAAASPADGGIEVSNSTQRTALNDTTIQP